MFLNTEIRSYHQGSGVSWPTASKTVYERERISTDMRSLFMLGTNTGILRPSSRLNKEAVVLRVFQVVDTGVCFLGRECTTVAGSLLFRKAPVIKAAQVFLFLVYIS